MTSASSANDFVSTSCVGPGSGVRIAERRRGVAPFLAERMKGLQRTVEHSGRRQVVNIRVIPPGGISM
jgi:hypothetical protein